MMIFQRAFVHDHDLATQKYVLLIVLFFTALLWSANGAPALAGDIDNSDFPFELRPIKMALSTSKTKVCRVEDDANPVSTPQNKNAKQDKNAPQVIMAESLSDVISPKNNLDVLQMGKALPTKAELQIQALLKQKQLRQIHAKQMQAKAALKPTLIEAHELPALPAVSTQASSPQTQIATQPNAQSLSNNQALSSPPTASPQMANVTPRLPVKASAPEATASIPQTVSAKPQKIRTIINPQSPLALPPSSVNIGAPRIPLPSDFE